MDTMRLVEIIKNSESFPEDVRTQLCNDLTLANLIRTLKEGGFEMSMGKYVGRLVVDKVLHTTPECLTIEEALIKTHALISQFSPDTLKLTATARPNIAGIVTYDKRAVGNSYEYMVLFGTAYGKRRIICEAKTDAEAFPVLEEQARRMTS